MHQAMLIAVFVVGFALHCLTAAAKAVREVKCATMWCWLVRWWPVALTRLVLTGALFLIYAENGSLADSLLSWAHITVEYSLPVTPATALLIGYFSDSILDLLGPKIPFLSRDIPTYQADSSKQG